MDAPTLHTLVQHLDHLERANRYWKRMAACAIALLGGLVLVGAAANKATKVPDELRAKRIVLVDKAEKDRAELLITADNRPSLVFMDQDRNPRFLLDLTEFGEPSLSFIDRQGKRRITLSLDLYGTLLRFTDEAGNLRVALAVPSEGDPELELVGRDDKSLWRVP